MHIEIDISAEIKEPYAVIHTNEMTPQINKLISYVQNMDHVIAVYEEDNIVILVIFLVK